MHHENRSMPTMLTMLTTISLCPCVWSVLEIIMRVDTICRAKEIAQIKPKKRNLKGNTQHLRAKVCQLLEFLTFSLRMRFFVRVACVRTWHAAVDVAELVVESIVLGKIYFHLPVRTVVRCQREHDEHEPRVTSSFDNRLQREKHVSHHTRMVWSFVWYMYNMYTNYSRAPP